MAIIPDDVVDPGLKEAYLEAQKHSWSRAELDDYGRARIKEQDEIGRVKLAEQRAEEKGIIKETRERKIERITKAPQTMQTFYPRDSRRF